MPIDPVPSAISVPLVIQLGFAGARELFDQQAHPQVDPAKFEAAVVEQLAGLLQDLPAKLRLDANGPHFFCGVSQIAIGADTAFTLACRQQDILQRIVLPQPPDAYLAAKGSAAPDFTPAQQVAAKNLLGSKHIIQTPVVSDSANRRERFQDVNLEIASTSDVVICLVRAAQEDKAGGTHELAELARKRKRPLILLEVSVDTDGNPVITILEDTTTSFVAPTLPQALGAISLPATPSLPSGQDYGMRLKELGSTHANRLRVWFKSAALIIVVGHVLATAMAVGVLKLEGSVVIIFLAAELLLLAFGLLVHYRLHHSQSLARWAAFRLIAEITRSMTAVRNFPLHLEHFFSLPVPPDFRAMLHTIHMLHLRDTATTSTANWGAQRSRYVRDRLRGPGTNAQIPYHQATKAWAERGLRLAQRIFYIASFSALVATLAKLLIKLDALPVPVDYVGPLGTILGFFAILAPVFAVAALSLAVAFDLEAKKHTSQEMIELLERQANLLESASTQREFSKLLIETESRLLGETVNWYARRSFVGVA